MRKVEEEPRGRERTEKWEEGGKEKKEKDWKEGRKA